jgi:hypothetical protein
VHYGKGHYINYATSDTGIGLVGVAVTLSNYIRDIPVSNLGLDTG